MSEFIQTHQNLLISLMFLGVAIGLWIMVPRKKDRDYLQSWRGKNDDL